MPTAIKPPAAESAYSLLALPEDSVDPVVAEAIMWMVNLKSGEATDRERTEFAAWYEADPAHQRAWKHLTDSLGPMSVASTSPLTKGSLARRVNKKSTSRRQMLKGATLGVVVVAGAAISDRLLPLRSMLADYRTWTGEEQEVALPDGGSMILGPRAAVNFRSDGHKDQIELLAGDLFIRSGNASQRRIDISMSDWFLTLPSGRVSLHYNGSQVAAVALDTSMMATIAGGAPFEVHARQKLTLEGGLAVRRTANIAREESWSRGLLVLEDDSLDSLIEHLRPYFVGLIRVTPAANKLRIAGVFKLREPRNTLVALSEAFPIRVREVTPYWISIDLIT